MLTSVNVNSKSVTCAFEKVLGLLKEYGMTSSPRGLEIKELLDCNICIKNPRDRIVRNPLRQMNLSYAVGELLWYLSARNDLEMIQHYSALMSNFSDDGETLNSAYGYRIFGKHKQIGFNQWTHVKSLLEKDPDTRQAIIHLHTPNNTPTKDEVCTLSLQFFIRENKLNLIANMRSNDIIKGFTYDVFAFTMLQEIMANELGIELGHYFHHAGSMHIYEGDYNYLESLNKNPFGQSSVENFPMLPINMQLDDFNRLIDFEQDCRIKPFNKVCNEIFPTFLTNSNSIEKIFASSLFVWKIIREEKINLSTSTKSELIDNVINENVRQVDERYADYLSAGSGPFGYGHEGIKIFIEGVDGAGKTSLAEYLKANLPGVLNVGEFNLQHYNKPTKNFEYINNYIQATQSKVNNIFDRFALSEITYGIERGATRISPKEVAFLFSLIGDNENTVFILLAPNGYEAEKVKKRLKAEDLYIDVDTLCEAYNKLNYFLLENVKVKTIIITEAEFDYKKVLYEVERKLMKRW